MTFENGCGRSVRVGAIICFLGLYGASAATLCVDQSGKGKCYTTIGAAVAAANPGDVLAIAAGQYAESVTITKSISLVGAGPGSTIINAKGLANGIYLNGLDNPGLSNVLITGLTVMNANFEGILLTNASEVLLSNNHVTNNDQGLNYAAGSCAGLPAFETNEGEDCGEGVHLVGAFAVTVANNVVDLNAGGILLTDETSRTYENYIVSNDVHDNALDCGITLASHAPAASTGSKSPFGVFSNSIVGNSSMRNGLAGAGAGVGIFAPGPGNMAFSNKVIGNVIVGNGQAGVAMHNHASPPGAPAPNMNGNVVMRNFIAGNGADTGDAATPASVGVNVYSVAPVYDTQILENTIQDEGVGVAMNHPGGMIVHLNNLPSTGMGVANLNKAGTMDANLNYFGCAAGPGTQGCSSVSGGVNVAVWLKTAAAAAPSAPAKRPLP